MSDISGLLSYRRQKQKELNTYITRKGKIEIIKNDLNRHFDDNISGANNNRRNTESYLGKGLKGVGQVSHMLSEIAGLEERSVWGDSNITETRTHLEQEISRCQSQINTLTSEIRRIDRQIEALSSMA